MTSKQIESMARKLLRNSLTIDAVDPQKVTAVISGLKELKPNNLLEIYQSYLELLQLKIEEHTAYVETPLSPDAVWAKEMEEELKKKFPSVLEVRFIVNESLIAGLKVKIADMVYENSFKNKLNLLRSMH